MKSKNKYFIHVTWLDSAEVVDTTDTKEEFNAIRIINAGGKQL